MGRCSGDTTEISGDIGLGFEGVTPSSDGLTLPRTVPRTLPLTLALTLAATLARWAGQQQQQRGEGGKSADKAEGGKSADKPGLGGSGVRVRAEVG